jgi:hypothetical protein
MRYFAILIILIRASDNPSVRQDYSENPYMESCSENFRIVTKGVTICRNPYGM